MWIEAPSRTPSQPSRSAFSRTAMSNARAWWPCASSTSTTYVAIAAVCPSVVPYGTQILAMVAALPAGCRGQRWGRPSAPAVRSCRARRGGARAGGPRKEPPRCPTPRVVTRAYAATVRVSGGDQRTGPHESSSVLAYRDRQPRGGRPAADPCGPRPQLRADRRADRDDRALHRGRARGHLRPGGRRRLPDRSGRGPALPRPRGAGAGAASRPAPTRSGSAGASSPRTRRSPSSASASASRSSAPAPRRCASWATRSAPS